MQRNPVRLVTTDGLNRLRESWHEWALNSQEARYRKRSASSMADLRAFYDALLPRMDEIITYLDRSPVSQLEETDRELLNLALAFVEVSLAVELFGEPDEATAMPGPRITIATPMSRVP